MRLALIGAGFIGTVHAANAAAHPGIKLVSVHDVDVDRARELADQHGAHASDDLAAFDPGAVDAVLIASSTDTHATYLRAAADAGLAVLCEKPIDLDLDRAVEITRHVVASGVPAMVDFNRRFDRDHAELASVVAAGGVGDVELVQMSTRGPSVPPLSYVAVSGGQMRDQTVHFFDLVRWITGADPVEVYAAGSALAEPRLTEFGDVDTSVVTLRLPGGALVQIDSARRIGYGYDERIEVSGSTGMVEAARQRTGSVARYSAGQIVHDGMHAGWFERVQASYASALDHFVSSVAAGTPPSPSLLDGLKAQAVAEAATRSLATGRPETIDYPVL